MAKGCYEVGRQVLVKPDLGLPWVGAVVVSSRPLRVVVNDGDKVWDGAELFPHRIKAAVHSQRGAA